MRRLLLLLPLFLVASLHAADWPQWRGEKRDGVWAEKGLPDKFPVEGLKPRWRKPIGGGYSGIAVAGGRVYTMDHQTQPNEVERVLCFDASTGELLWKHEYAVKYGKLDYGNGPRATPTVHDGKVYTFGALGQLCCLDAAKGTVVWEIDTAAKYRARIPTWGHSCSPLVEGEKLLVQVGAPDACLMAFDCASGKELWRSLPDAPGYASPVMIGGKDWRQLAYWLPERVVGLDLESGKLRWQVKFKEPVTYGVSISDLVWHDGVLLASDYWFGSTAITFDDRGENPKVVWDGRRLSLLMSTPLVRDGHVYALDKQHGLECIEMKTGTVKWKGEHITPKSRNPQAVLVWIGERSLIFNEKGELILAKLTPEKYEEQSRTRILKKDTWAHPAFADRCVFVRNDEELLCVPLVGE
jgi:hypothetical protein